MSFFLYSPNNMAVLTSFHKSLSLMNNIKLIVGLRI